MSFSITELCADVIGYIAKYSTVFSKVPKGREQAAILREVFIRDLRYMLKQKRLQLQILFFAFHIAHLLKS